MKQRIKENRMALFLTALFFLGMVLFAYPTFSDYWNSRYQAEVITDYAQELDGAEAARDQKIWEEAEIYNEGLAKSGNLWGMTEEERSVYEQCLSLENTDMMSYIEIPVIDCSLPIYHGTEEAVLQKGVGHMEGSSLPVGGESSHCVLTGHRGLPSARLFTDLDQLSEGDIFMLHTLGKTLYYEVDQIAVVEPTDFSKLEIVEGGDYCTLVTCTPYAVNTHRLLVRGCRITNALENVD